MAEFTSHAPGTPCWVDLMSPDVAASTAFYTAVFGWETDEQHDDDDGHIYTLFKIDGKSTAGLGGQPPGTGEMPAVWNTYIATDDCTATAEKVTAAGGGVIMPPMQVTEAGEMAVFTDPTGAAFSVWKAGEHVGVEIGNVANAYSWNELMTRDLDAALAFYTDVFGWSYDVGAMPDGSYNLIEGGAEGIGGIMAMPPDTPDMVPNNWSVYFSVADIAATVEAITSNGGQIVVEPFAIPGVGTTAVAHDPAGGNFCIMQPEQA